MLHTLRKINIISIASSNTFHNLVTPSHFSDSIRVSTSFFVLLADALRKTKVLTHLHCSNILTPLSLEESDPDPDPDPHVILSQGLKENNTLIDLNLSDNNISTQGLEALVQSLQNNKSLLSLNLLKNKITLKDAAPFNQFCKTSNILYASYNNISKDVSALLDARRLEITSFIKGYKSGTAYILAEYSSLLHKQKEIVFVAEKEALLNPHDINQFQYHMQSAVIAINCVRNPILSILPKELQRIILDFANIEGQQNLAAALCL